MLENILKKNGRNITNKKLKYLKPYYNVSLDFFLFTILFILCFSIKIKNINVKVLPIVLHNDYAYISVCG